jgi:sec-independent protein translocase protein TatC
MVALGIVVGFQLPVVMLILGRTGLIDARQIAAVRTYGVFGCFAAAAILTPTDVISMVIMALPLWALFEIGLLLMRLAQPADEAPE